MLQEKTVSKRGKKIEKLTSVAEKRDRLKDNLWKDLIINGYKINK